jgi:hypothetical protein
MATILAALSFTWLAYSEHDRRKMVDVISAFRGRDTQCGMGMEMGCTDCGKNPWGDSMAKA